MPRLPVSGMAFDLRPPDGADDLAIIEVAGSAVARALAILPRLARLTVTVAGAPNDETWASLTVTDFEFALLALRVRLFGEHLACTFDCPHENCHERMEVAFMVADFVADVRPRQPRGVRADDSRPGWFRLDDSDGMFRLPTVGDQAIVVGNPRALRDLTRLCIEPPDLPARNRARIERAMARLAPEISRPIVGRCHGCAEAIAAPLHVSRLVMDELRRVARFVHDDIHLIAKAYHWSEASILALPRARRREFAERIRQHDQAA